MIASRLMIPHFPIRRSQTVYSRLGNVEKGYQYFLENARVDLDNTHGNTKDGIHTASMGGTFLTIIEGFCHLSFDGNGPKVEPHLPKEIEEISFNTIYYRERICLFKSEFWQI